MGKLLEQLQANYIPCRNRHVRVTPSAAGPHAQDRRGPVDTRGSNGSASTCAHVRGARGSESGSRDTGLPAVSIHRLKESVRLTGEEKQPFHPLPLIAPPREHSDRQVRVKTSLAGNRLLVGRCVGALPATSGSRPGRGPCFPRGQAEVCDAGPGRATSTPGHGLLRQRTPS